MADRLTRFVKNLENARAAFPAWLITFFCTVFLRNFIEAFSDRDNFWTVVSSPAYFIHFPMFYLCIFLALAILLHWLTGEKITRISKIMLLFFPLILLAPILDLFLSRGQGYNMSYLLGDMRYLIHQFITFSGGYSGRGASPGLRIELIVVLVLVGYYLYLKTGKFLRAAIGVITSYVLIFVFGSLPSIISVFWNLKGSVTGPEELFSGGVVMHHFYSFDHKMAMVLYPILLIELGLWHWSYDRQKFLALVKNFRGLRVFHYLCMLGGGLFLGYAVTGFAPLFHSPFSFLIITASLCSVALAWWFAAGVNDLNDLEADRISNPSRPLVSGIINADEYRALILVSLLLSLLAAHLVRYPFFVTILLTTAFSYLYSAPPFRIKKAPFLATFVLALSSVLICLAGFVLFSDDYSFCGFPPRVLLTILVAYTLAFTIKDIKDLKGDRLTGTVTLPTLLGEEKGKRITGILVVLAYLNVPLLLKLLRLAPFAMLLGIPNYYLIKRKRFRETPVFVLYFLFLGVTLYYVYFQLQDGIDPPF